MEALQLLPTPTLTYPICSISSEKLAAESWGPCSYVLSILLLLPTTYALSLLKSWQQSHRGLAVTYSPSLKLAEELRVLVPLSTVLLPVYLFEKLTAESCVSLLYMVFTVFIYDTMYFNSVNVLHKEKMYS